MRAALALPLLALALAGCTAPPAPTSVPLGACDPAIEAEGLLVRVKVVWANDSTPAPSPCVRALREGVAAATVRADAQGQALLRVRGASYTIAATLLPHGQRCAHHGETFLEVQEPTFAEVRLPREATRCP